MEEQIEKLEKIKESVDELSELLEKLLKNYEEIIKNTSLKNELRYIKQSILRTISSGEKPDEKRCIYSEIKFNFERNRKYSRHFYRPLKQKLSPESCYYESSLDVLFVSESNQNVIFVLRDQQLIGTIDHQFAKPNGLVYFEGILYVCDEYNHQIQCFQIFDVKTHNKKFPTITWKFLYFIGYYGTTPDCLNKPYAICAGGSRLYICDRGNNRVVEMNPDTKQFEKVFDNLKNPSGVSWNYNEDALVISNTDDHHVKSVSTTGTGLWMYGNARGREINQFCKPSTICVTELCSFVFVLDECNLRIHLLEFDIHEKFRQPKLKTILSPVDSEIKNGFRPNSICLGKNEKVLYICDKGQGLIHFAEIEF